MRKTAVGLTHNCHVTPLFPRAHIESRGYRHLFRHIPSQSLGMEFNLALTKTIVTPEEPRYASGISMKSRHFHQFWTRNERNE